MIVLRKGNLRIPKWNRKVFAVAGGLTEYKKFCPEMKVKACFRTENPTNTILDIYWIPYEG